MNTTSRFPRGSLTNLVSQLDVALLRCRIFRGEEVFDGEEEQEELDGRPDRIVLVTRFDVSEEDGGAGYLLELHGDFVEQIDEPTVSVL